MEPIDNNPYMEIVWGESVTFDDANQSITYKSEYPTVPTDEYRMHINCPKEYFLRKLTGK